MQESTFFNQLNNWKDVAKKMNLLVQRLLELGNHHHADNLLNLPINVITWLQHHQLWSDKWAPCALRHGIQKSMEAIFGLPHSPIHKMINTRKSSLFAKRLSQEWEWEREREREREREMGFVGSRETSSKRTGCPPWIKDRSGGELIKAGPPLEAILAIFGRRALIFFCLKGLGKKWKMTPLLCACAVVITLETQKCRKRAPRSVEFNFFNNCDRQKRFSQTGRRRAGLQNVASDFLIFAWGLSNDLSKFIDDFTPFLDFERP